MQLSKIALRCLVTIGEFHAKAQPNKECDTVGNVDDAG